MELIIFTLFLWYPMISSRHLSNRVTPSNKPIIETTETLNEHPSYKLDEAVYVPHYMPPETEDIKAYNSKSLVAIMSIHPDGRVKCNIVNTLDT